jgi:ribosomal protein L37AE/L43A
MATTETLRQSEDHLETLPRNNPCAQCGALIPIPEWVEHDHGRAAYLWHCHACDYQFEAIAYFHEADDGHALAA